MYLVSMYCIAESLVSMYCPPPVKCRYFHRSISLLDAPELFRDLRGRRAWATDIDGRTRAPVGDGWVAVLSRDSCEKRNGKYIVLCLSFIDDLLLINIINHDQMSGVLPRPDGEGGRGGHG